MLCLFRHRSLLKARSSFRNPRNSSGSWEDLPFPNTVGGIARRSQALNLWFFSKLSCWCCCPVTLHSEEIQLHVNGLLEKDRKSWVPWQKNYLIFLIPKHAFLPKKFIGPELLNCALQPWYCLIFLPQALHFFLSAPYCCSFIADVHHKCPSYCVEAVWFISVHSHAGLRRQQIHWENVDTCCWHRGTQSFEAF